MTSWDFGGVKLQLQLPLAALWHSYSLAGSRLSLIELQSARDGGHHHQLPSAWELLVVWISTKSTLLAPEIPWQKPVWGYFAVEVEYLQAVSV